MTHLRPLFLLLLATAGCDGLVDMVVRPEEPAPRVDPSPALEPTETPVPPDESCDPSSLVGRVTLHRLNRAEYNNTVRDLLGETSRPADAFPSDDAGASFDNDADALSVSTLLFERYEAATRAMAAAALTRPALKILSCDPVTIGRDACARKVLGDFARKAWRRPLTLDEVEDLVAFSRRAADKGDPFPAQIQLALEKILLSPKFLYRAETSAGRLDGYELASRLSYFLWSSMPDEALLAAASSGQLQSQVELEAQAKRMLADPKASALSENLAGQWLSSRSVAYVRPDPAKYPFDDALRAGLQEETRLLLAAFLREDRPLVDLLDADFTFANERVAKHYGLPGVTGAQMQRVSLAGFPQRGGLLRQAGFLAANSNATTTSAVKRGKWVLTNLLCASPPPPPPGVEGLDKENIDPNAPLKVRMAQHRTNPSCSGCHSMMDPIGLALENYDPIGAWRTMDGQYVIDPSGELPGGEGFANATELIGLLKADSRVPLCVTRNLFTYALGRQLRWSDECAAASIVSGARPRGTRLTDLITGIVTSEQFRSRLPEQ
jgi:hypothetical protein